MRCMRAVPDEVWKCLHVEWYLLAQEGQCQSLLSQLAGSAEVMTYIVTTVYNGYTSNVTQQPLCTGYTACRVLHLVCVLHTARQEH
jgi:hypothetical protein